MRTFLRLAVALCAAGVLAVSVPRAASTAEATITVKVITVNDTHGYLEPGQTFAVPDPADPTKRVRVPVGGAAYLATAVRRLRWQNPRNILVGAGDLVGASPLSSGLFHDEPEIEALDMMGVALSAVGNHEFDEGKDELLRKQHGGCRPGGRIGIDTCLGGTFRGATFPYLAANVVDERTGKLLFPAYVIRRFHAADGRPVPIAFVGAVLKETPLETTAAGTRGVRFLDEADAINAQLPKLAAQGVHAVVALVHQGIIANADGNIHGCGTPSGDLVPILDRLDPSIPLVVSAHTHQAYVCVNGAGTKRSHATYVQASSFTRAVGDIDVTLDVAHDRIVRVHADTHLVGNDVVPDPDVAALVARYVTATAPLVNRQVGMLTAELNRDGQNAARGESGETTMADVIADSRLEMTAGTADRAVAGFINPGGVRADLSAGVVTYGAIYRVSPFNDLLITETLTGAQLYQLLTEQFVGHAQPFILGVSRGFTYTWDASKPDAQKIVPGSVKIDGVPVTPTGTYRVTIDDFLAGGGDGFATFKAGTDKRTGGVDHDVLERYFTTHTPLAPPARNRITRLN
jgi:5'-nucleotidase